MTLDYRTEIEPIWTEAVFDDPAYAEVLALTALDYDALDNRVFLFRDPRTIAALLKAPQDTRDVMAHNLVGLKPLEPGGPTGRAKFVRKELTKVQAAFSDGTLDAARAVKRVGRVMRFCHNVSMGIKRDAEGFPIVGDRALAQALRAPVDEEFDLNAFLSVQSEQLREETAAQAAFMAAADAGTHADTDGDPHGDGAWMAEEAAPKRGLLARMFG